MLGANIGIGNGPSAPRPSLVYASPLDLGAKLFNFWDATNFASLTIASGAVSAWADLVAGVSVTQGTAASRPAYDAVGMNGQPCLTFDGTDDRLFSTGAAGTYPIGATPGEIWAVLINDAPASGGTRHAAAYGLNGGAGNFRALGRGIFTASQRAITIAGPGGTSFTAQANHGASGNWVSTYDVLRGAHTAAGPHCDDNAVVGPTTAGTLGAGSTRATLNIGSGAGAANFWQGRIQKVLFTDALTDAEARALFNTLWHP